MGVWAFHDWKYIRPKSTQSTLLNILQLGIPTNQLAQPHSQSLNKYSIYAKKLTYPPPPRYHKVYFYSMAEGNLSLYTIQAQWDFGWRGGDITAG